jgi:hypothetical protein
MGAGVWVVKSLNLQSGRAHKNRWFRHFSRLSEAPVRHKLITGKTRSTVDVEDVFPIPTVLAGGRGKCVSREGWKGQWPCAPGGVWKGPLSFCFEPRGVSTNIAIERSRLTCPGRTHGGVMVVAGHVHYSHGDKSQAAKDVQGKQSLPGACGGRSGGFTLVRPYSRCQATHFVRGHRTG